jgi:anti-sigma B factor antagonist
LKPVPLEIAQQDLAPATVLITLAGRLMLGPEGQMLERTVDELLATGYRKFIFDLSGITHIDSTGIGRCISSLNRIMASGGQLHMAAAGRQVREGFRVTRLDRVFRFFDDVPAAQSALA